MKRSIGNNLFSSLLSYCIIMILNFAFSKVIMLGYGSETNGLISTINQIFTYIALLEAGIGMATINALYQPVAQKDSEGIADVMYASKKYYRKAACWYFFCVVAVSVVWPLVIDSKINYAEIFFLVLLQGVSSVITFCYISTITNFLIASGKNYINNYVNVLITFFTFIFKVIICVAGKSILFLSLATLLLNVCKCICYRIYAQKVIPEYFVKRELKKERLKEKNAYVLHEISGVVFSSTDMIIISIFCSLADASVYAVYSMPFNALSTVCLQAVNSLSYILGQSYVKEGYEKIHDSFNSLYVFVVFVLFTCAYLLVIPFVSLYTSGITDINYFDPKLPFLFTAIQLLSSMRIIDNNLIKIAGHAQKTISRTITETSINLIVSLVLVHFIGIYGVLIGTIVALLYRTIDMILYANWKILKRSALREVKLFVPNLLVFGLFVVLNNRFVININSVFEFITKGFLVFSVVLSAYLICNLVGNYNEARLILKRILKKL